MYRQDEQKQELTVDTPSWFAWLETASTFSFVSDEGHFTARQERSSQQRGGRYWKAYRKQHGKLSSRYLGKSEALTLERLRVVAVALADAPSTTSHHGYGTAPVPSPPPVGDPLHPLLTTKLHPPRPRAQLVPRSHLIKQLQEGMAGPLTLVSAPAGYGKTTLLTTNTAWMQRRQALPARSW